MDFQAKTIRKGEKVEDYFIWNIEEVVGSFYGLGWNEFVLLHKTTKMSEMAIGIRISKRLICI